MIAAGVFAGTSTPCGEIDSKPGTLALIVATPGSSAEGCKLATPSTRNRPDLMYGIAEPALGNINSTSPPINPITPGPVPLYATCTMFKPSRLLNNSAARCGFAPSVPAA